MSAREVVFFCAPQLISRKKGFRRFERTQAPMLQQAAFKLAAGQIALTVAVVIGAGWLGDKGAAFSAAIGGGIGIVAGLYQALRIFRADAAADPERFLRSVYVSEAIKIVLTVALMIAAIRALNVQFLPFMLGYVATYVAYWAALGTGYPWLGDVQTEVEEQNRVD